MSADNFIRKWKTTSPEKRLLTMLTAATKLAGGTLELDIRELLAVESGETVVSHIEGDKLVLRASPIYTEMYVVKETSGWTDQETQTPAERAVTAHIPTDAELADLEDRTNRATELRKAARQKRMEPLFQTRQ
jgi:hypothetical protein